MYSRALWTNYGAEGWTGGFGVTGFEPATYTSRIFSAYVQ